MKAVPCARAPKRGVGQGTFHSPLGGGSVSGLGSTLLFRGIVMAEQNIPDLPLPPDKWEQLLKELSLPPQQVRIVELILRNHCDKQIAAALGLKVPTVRTYLHRIFERLHVGDRLELVLRLFALSHRNDHLQR
jgi:DNA-binding NarL/FixJ family response regulator